jgi:hypothetical protein
MKGAFLVFLHEMDKFLTLPLYHSETEAASPFFLVLPFKFARDPERSEGSVACIRPAELTHIACGLVG